MCIVEFFQNCNHFSKNFTRYLGRYIKKGFTDSRNFTHAAAIMIPLVAIGPANALELKTSYTMSVGSFSIGQANLTTRILPREYHIKAGLNLVGLAELFANMKAATAVNGEIINEQIYPAHFFSKAQSGKDERTVRMTMVKGNVGSVSVIPPLMLRNHDIPLEKHHKRSVLDPLSALLMPVSASRDMLAPENCNRSIPVFDGGARMNILLKYKETRDAHKGYKGKVLVCSVQYTSIAGYQPSEKATNYLQKNKNMTVWLAPVDKTHFLMPVRANVETPAGSVVFEATRWKVTTDIASR